MDGKDSVSLLRVNYRTQLVQHVRFNDIKDEAFSRGLLSADDLQGIMNTNKTNSKRMADLLDNYLPHKKNAYQLMLDCLKVEYDDIAKQIEIEQEAEERSRKRKLPIDIAAENWISSDDSDSENSFEDAEEPMPTDRIEQELESPGKKNNLLSSISSKDNLRLDMDKHKKQLLWLHEQAPLLRSDGWVRLAKELHLTEAQIALISAANRHSDPREAPWQMLSVWIESNGYLATLAVLTDALRACKMHDMAAILEAMF